MIMFLWRSGTYLAIFVNLWLLPVNVEVGAWPCNTERIVHSADSFNLLNVGRPPPGGEHLRYVYRDPILIQHSCGKRFKSGIPPSLYLGENVFFSLDNFESSRQPLSIPSTLTTPPALVSAAAFVQTRKLLLVVNGIVYLYLFHDVHLWKTAKGIKDPVTELSNYDCCFAPKDRICSDISKMVLAYDTGDLANTRQIFYSKDGGYSFRPIESRPHYDGTLLRVYYFASTSEIGMLVNRTEDNATLIYFTYGDIEYVADQTGTPFDLNLHDDDKILSILPPGLRGFLILWTHEHFMSSSNNGLTTETVTVLPTHKYPNTSFPTHDEGVCFVAATSYEVAAITKNRLFYGSLDMVSSQMVLLGENNVSTLADPCEVMMFEHIGLLSIIYPVPSYVSDYYNFHKCTINIQARLMDLRPPMQPCPIEILDGVFHDRMFYIDINDQLYFNVTFVPKPGTGAHPYVTVGNPHVLAFWAHTVHEGYTYDGNPKYILHIKLLEQRLSGMSHEDFYDDYLTGKVSTVTVDVYNKGIFCVDMHPQTALIAVDCPPKKHIRVVKSTTACYKDLFKPRLMQNFTYVIDKNLYDPFFLGRKNIKQEDHSVPYKYEEWECPLLLYYDSPWIPSLELWENDAFVEHVPADFVLIEINGMHNYDYLLNEVEANCLSAAQNWTTQILLDPFVHPADAWSRYNYHSCKTHKGNNSLPSTASKYQVLNMNENNRVIFPQYSGIYVFKIVVVDPLYSYCNLNTTVSVYVHGALPKSEINVGKTLVSFLVLIFGSILMAYYFPKLMKENARMKSIWD
ncbi:cation channel sperm-associated auxiliary subunit delta-like [Anolis carolinensis]|uniref:Cation channel sperm-associated auxiliary subunit delta n=1 Tax=Anolis carolinensis TaxID=28377 RepID=A0A803SMQ7_ANOCA